jgi:UDP-N-acetylmuramyl pentapeptide phosphotransferase/UDP-N-acetylglucosamine-1-phosphate transferase
MRWDALILLFVAIAASSATAPLVIRAGVEDAPDRQRKAHHTVTATSGGLAIAAGFALALTVACLMPGLRWKDELTLDMVTGLGLSALLAFAALVLGLIDDLRPLDARVKFGAIGAMALLFSLFVARADMLPLFGGVNVQLGFVLGVLGSALWLFTIVNATNFMDGANGMAMGQMAIGLIGLAIISQISGAPNAAMLAVAGAGGAIGFLVWNFPSGKLFAGDAGSLFIGTAAGAASLVAIADGGVSPFVPVILFFPILADVLLTLAWRLAKGRSLLESHRDHVYQIGLRSRLGHAKVSLFYWAAAFVCAVVAVVSDLAQKQSPALDGAAAGAAFGAPFIAWVVLAILSVLISLRVRKFAYAQGLDGD